MASGVRSTGSVDKPVPRAAGRRSCPVCGARLTTYNPGPNCYRHTVSVPWRGPLSQK